VIADGQWVGSPKIVSASEYRTICFLPPRIDYKIMDKAFDSHTYYIDKYNYQLLYACTIQMNNAIICGD